MARRRTKSWWLVSLACASVSIACSQQATLHVRDGTEHRGKILRYDGKYVLIDDDRGRVVAVDRSAIADVDHPGTPAAVVGAALIAVGAATAYSLATHSCDEDDTLTCGEQEDLYHGLTWYVFGLYAVPGAAMLTYGGLVWAASVDNYETARGPRIVRPHPRSPAPGLTLQGSF